jgi:tetratricopeptide (TPR) repeat protein
MKDIDEAVSNIRHAVELVSEVHSELPGFLSNLSTCYVVRFDALREIFDLDEAIILQNRAVELIPNGHADCGKLLSNLGCYMLARFRFKPDQNNIGHALSCLQTSLQLTTGQSSEITSLHNLSLALVASFDFLQEPQDLDEAILFEQRAIERGAEAGTSSSRSLFTLGRAYERRFRLYASLSDINEAVTCITISTLALPIGHPNCPSQLGTLGLCFSAAFGHFKMRGDYQNAILAFRRSTEALGDSPSRLMFARAWATFARSEGDFKSALDAYTVAIELLPEVAWLGLKRAGSRFSSVTEELNTLANQYFGHSL